MHRVQRVPVTESQGRIHTSAAGVLVLPEAEEVDVTVDPNDLRIDVFRSSGPVGQSVNTTDSAVRITHLPSGIVVSSQNEKSQLQNRESALRVLRSRLLAAAREEAAATASDQRRSQVRTVDRSERVRTYNFPENRISDHRVGYKAHNLDQVLDGDLDAVIDALRARTPPSCWRPAPNSARCSPTPRGGWPTPASTPRVWTPSCCWPPSSAAPAPGRSPSPTSRRRAARFAALLDQRADRVPLQHLTGRAPFRLLELAVGPGVFVPRPETEQLTVGAGTARRALRSARRGPRQRLRRHRAVDRARAPRRAGDRRRARSRGHRLDPAQRADPRRRGDTPVGVVAGDMTDPACCPSSTAGSTSSSPTRPTCPTTPCPREVADHDPPLALWGGPDGLDVVRGMLGVAARLLRPAAGWASSTPTSRGGRCPPSSVRTGGSPTSRTTPTSPAGPASPPPAAGDRRTGDGSAGGPAREPVPASGA